MKYQMNDQFQIFIGWSYWVDMWPSTQTETNRRLC